MYFYQQLRNIVRPAEIPTPPKHYVMESVEIDNPVHECKFTVPCFVEVAEKVPAFAELPASNFGLQTLFEAGVTLRPSTIVNGSYLREVEKFLDAVSSKKL